MKSKTTSLDVLLFYPNLIELVRKNGASSQVVFSGNYNQYEYKGNRFLCSMKTMSVTGSYVRVTLVVASSACMSQYHFTAMLLYFVNVVLDYIDGPVARHYNQCTKFGELLDVVTDSAATVGLCIKLSQFYPEYTFHIQMMSLLLFVGPFTNLHSATATGYKYKDKGKKQPNPVLNLFYMEPCFGIVVMTTETFFMLLYALHFTEGFTVPGTNVGIVRVLLFAHLPFITFRSIVFLSQTFTAFARLASFDAQLRTSTTDLHKKTKRNGDLPR